MSAKNSNGTIELDLGNGDRIWWSDKSPWQINRVSTNPMFHDGAGGHIGLWVTYSANPKSVNYDPGNYNRCARALQEKHAHWGLAVPAQVEEHSRLYKDRKPLIDRWNKDQASFIKKNSF